MSENKSPQKQPSRENPRPNSSSIGHLRPTWKLRVHLLSASARWSSRPRTSSSGSSSVGLALCMVGQLGTSMLWQPRWRWLTEPCESVWSDFSDAGYSQPKQGKGGKRNRERGREGGKREKERATEWNKAVWLHGFYLSLHISDIPPHSLGWSWQGMGRSWCARGVCSDSSLNGIVTSHNVCARVHVKERERERERARKPMHTKGCANKILSSQLWSRAPIEYVV